MSISPNISIHAAREGGDFNTRHCNFRYTVISIHAAREGGDTEKHCSPMRIAISIHAAREGGD